MKDAPTGSEGEGDAPAGPRNPWVSWLMWALLTPVAYVLSCGPVAWLVEHHYLSEGAMFIYQPLDLLEGEPMHLLRAYVDWWSH